MRQKILKEAKLSLFTDDLRNPQESKNMIMEVLSLSKAREYKDNISNRFHFLKKHKIRGDKFNKISATLAHWKLGNGAEKN